MSGIDNVPKSLAVCNFFRPAQFEQPTRTYLIGPVGYKLGFDIEK